MKNILIVESENDQYFIEALINHISLDAEIFPVIREFQHSSLDEKKLSNAISNQMYDAAQSESIRVGVILDMDDANEKERLVLVNKCIENARQEILGNGSANVNIVSTLEKVGQFISINIEQGEQQHILEIACFFVHIDGQGEMESVLKAIKCEDSTFADCLDTGWKQCLESKGVKIGLRGEPCRFSEKELLKLWVDFYKRFDTLKRTERNKESTNWKGIMDVEQGRGKKIFDLNSSKLEDIKEFLGKFNVHQNLPQ